MTRYLLDTDVISEVRKPKPHGAVIAWVLSLQANELFLSAVSIGELQAGVERTRLNDPAKAGEIEIWIEQVIESYRILPMDALCFREWGRLMEGTPDELMEDAMIAAMARVHGLTVATRNEADFKQLDVPILNPFRPLIDTP